MAETRRALVDSRCQSGRPARGVTAAGHARFAAGARAPPQAGRQEAGGAGAAKRTAARPRISRTRSRPRPCTIMEDDAVNSNASTAMEYQ